LYPVNAVPSAAQPVMRPVQSNQFVQPAPTGTQPSNPNITRPMSSGVTVNGNNNPNVTPNRNPSE